MSANAEIIAELRRVLNERDEARAALAACPDCAMYAERSARFAEQADQLMRERDELLAQRARMAEQIKTLDRNAETFIEDAGRMRRERDEAREELSTLRKDYDSVLEANVGLLDDAPWADVRRAYRRGAEAMREACARWMSEREGISQWVYDDALSALPIPEES
jgi:uncharacterized coiled-coil DUF342 family protein